jgi:hypothetical protein
VQGQPNGAECGFSVEKTHPASRRHLRQARGHVFDEPWDATEHPAGQNRGKCIAAHTKPRNHRRCRGGELGTGTRQDVGGHGIAAIRGPSHEGRDAGNHRPVHVALVHLRNQVTRARQMHLPQHEIAQRGAGPAPVSLAHHR